MLAPVREPHASSLIGPDQLRYERKHLHVKEVYNARATRPIQLQITIFRFVGSEIFYTQCIAGQDHDIYFDFLAPQAALQTVAEPIRAVLQSN